MRQDKVETVIVMEIELISDVVQFLTSEVNFKRKTKILQQVQINS